ncbi:MAG: PhnD/SsuA/transferrin family substrate-binding protein [Gammaproteobacteria bacterium]|nr:PhnD/SsuA/transferrin family substrate-binding protein [Gammaproteobacteria bacterium]
MVLALMLFSPLSLAADDGGDPAVFNFGITPVFLVDQAAFLEGWKEYLSARLDRPVRFVRRKSYAEISDMLLSGQLDAAWLCTFPYVFNRASLRLVAIPEFQGEPYYRSYLIVPARDQTSRGYGDLEGAVFAYVEPRSNTGYLYPRFVITGLGREPQEFFRQTFFTWSHPEVVTAVAEGVADAGAVDGYIWEVMARRDPQLTARTRVVERSIQFGFPPVVAGVFLDDDVMLDLRSILMNMHRDPAGQALLDVLYLDRFVEPREDIYDNIPAMMERVLQISK